MSEETSHIRSASCNSHRNGSWILNIAHYAKYQKQKMLRNLGLQGGCLESDGFAKKPVCTMIFGDDLMQLLSFVITTN